METGKISNDEAKKLIRMVKRSLISEIDFPEQGKGTEFNVIGDTKNDLFAISIYRGKIKPLKYELGARIKKNGTMLIELHINPTKIHTNPDGEKIIGSHWHIYTEEYGRALAFPAEDIEDEKFIDNTVDFLVRFNVVERPNILKQLELL